MSAPGQRVLASCLAALALGAGACAQPADGDRLAVDTADEPVTEPAVDTGFEATAVYLIRAAAKSTDGSYRYEMRFSSTGEIADASEPVAKGEVDGYQYHLVLDTEVMMRQPVVESFTDPLPPGSLGLDFTMEAGGDREAMYLRAPVFASYVGMSGAEGIGPFADLAVIGDGWGQADMAALGDQLPTDVAAALGVQALDAETIVALLWDADDVRDLGPEVIDGVAVHGLAATLSLGDLLETLGQDLGSFAQLGPLGADDVRFALYEARTPVSVWVDDDGYLRRVAYGYSMDAIAAAAGGEPGMAAGVEHTYTLDMFDHGTTHVDFEPPDDAVDITAAYAALVRP